METFRYPLSIPFPGIDTFRYLISIPSSGIDTFQYFIVIPILGINTSFDTKVSIPAIPDITITYRLFFFNFIARFFVFMYLEYYKGQKGQMEKTQLFSFYMIALVYIITLQTESVGRPSISKKIGNQDGIARINSNRK